MSRWNAELYLQFAGERTRPAVDLLARVDMPAPRRILDVGCGPGNSTSLLRTRWPEAQVVGLDASPDMIAAARRDFPDGIWELGDASVWTADEPFDVVFSNAAIQWMPNHAELLPKLLGHLHAGGVLAVQIPTHTRSRVHMLIDELAQQPPWRERLAAARRAMTIETAEFYYDALQPHVARVELWQTEYFHQLAGPEAIVDWMRGTGLRPFLAALADDAERQAFCDRLLQGVGQAYPRQIDGKVLFPFRRLFFIAQRP